MQAIGIVALVIFALGLIVLAVLGLVVRAIFSRQDNGALEDETRMVQDMYRTMNKLEERITVLETILAERRIDPQAARRPPEA